MVSTNLAGWTEVSRLRMDSLIFAVIEQLSDANTIDEVAEHSERFAKSLGYAFFLLAVGLPTSLSKPRKVALTNYPERWLRRYGQCHYADVDPVNRWALTRPEPCWWDHLDRAEGQVRKYFEDAARHGIDRGVTVPLHGPNSQHAALSLCAGTPPPGKPARCDQSAHMWHFALNAVPAVQRIVAARGREPEHVLLTPRQRQALTLASEGMPVKQIADRLGIAKVSVEYLIQRATEKLGARNREQAIIRALATGQIGPLPYPESFEYLSGRFTTRRRR
jgi:DNA-binding CsgD family transcriptional regulator